MLDPKNIMYMLFFVFALGLILILAKKYKLTKYQIMIFTLLVIFWSSINIIRAYRKAYAGIDLELGGLGLSAITAANISAAYGLISMFVRLPLFALSDYINSRKILIGASLVGLFLTSAFVVVSPSADSLYLSSLALGLGASLLAMFNVMFAETFTSEQAMVSVSILSIAPLLAEFFVAPIQYLATSGPVKNYGFLWSISALLSLIAFGLLLKMKDNKSKETNFTKAGFKFVLKDYHFLVLCVLGIIVSFLKFGSSGSNLVRYASSESILMDPLLIAYLDVIFSFTQLVAGVMMGIYLRNKIGSIKTLLLGLICSVGFIFSATFITNPIALFVLSAFNGFGYGLTYNALLGLVMERYSKNYREISMGIYQTFFAIGIFYGDKIYALITNIAPEGIFNLAPTPSVFALLGMVGIVTIIIVTISFRKEIKLSK